LSRREKEPVICPICGAPRKKYIPPPGSQVKCEYCGTTFFIPQIEEPVTETADFSIVRQPIHCPNHPDKLATEECDDCKEKYCEECITTYETPSEYGNISVHLCPSCLKMRKAKLTGSFFVVGIMFLLFGFFAMILTFWLGLLIVILGLGTLAYGINETQKQTKPYD
jgi:hypothetical protein